MSPTGADSSPGASKPPVLCFRAHCHLLRDLVSGVSASSLGGNRLFQGRERGERLYWNLLASLE